MSEFVHVVVRMARSEIEAHRASQASQLLTSPARCDSQYSQPCEARALFPIRCSVLAVAFSKRLAHLSCLLLISTKFPARQQPTTFSLPEQSAVPRSTFRLHWEVPVFSDMYSCGQARRSNSGGCATEHPKPERPVVQGQASKANLGPNPPKLPPTRVSKPANEIKRRRRSGTRA